MLSGCGFSITIGDNNPPVDASADATVDATMVDTPTDTTTCPPFYRTIGTGRYAVLEPTNFKNHMSACASHGTHLAVIDDAQELLELVVYGRTVPGAASNARFYVGLVQAPQQQDPDDAWVDFHDRDANEDFWASSGGNEPDDGPDDNEANHQEQVAAIQLDRDALTDLPHTENVRAYCECDGAAIGPNASMYAEALP